MKVNYLVFLLVLFTGNSERVIFQSKVLRKLSLENTDINRQITDDLGEKITLNAKVDSLGMIYWFRKLETPVCLSGQCKEISIGIYWYSTGKFLGLEVYNEDLTKTDHSVFTEADYEKLISVLNDDWSILREYEYDDLLNEEMEGVDGITGATKKEIVDETVEGAVYTSYTLWHLIHRGENEQIENLTAQCLNNDKRLLDVFLNSSNEDYKKFVLKMLIDRELNPTDRVTSLVFEYLTPTYDIVLREWAFKSLHYLNIEHPKIQTQLASVFSNLSAMEKLRIINILDVNLPLEPIFYDTLVEELKYLDEWGASKVLNIIKNYPKHKSDVINLAKTLSTSSNSYVKKLAIEFLDINSMPK